MSTLYYISYMKYAKRLYYVLVLIWIFNDISAKLKKYIKFLVASNKSLDGKKLWLLIVYSKRPIKNSVIKSFIEI